MSKYEKSNPKDPSNIHAYKPERYSFAPSNAQGQLQHSGAGLHSEDQTGVLMNLLAMIMSMMAMLMKVKWAGWIAIFASVIGYATSQSTEDSRQILSSVMLGVASTFMSYMHTPGSLSQMLFG